MMYPFFISQPSGDVFTTSFLHRTVCILFFAGVFACTDVFAQQGLQGLDYENVYARPGQPTNTVRVWGQVSQPGLWRVEQGTDLLDFLTILQVPGVGRDEAGYRQHFTIRVYRQEGQDRSEIFSQRLDHMLEGEAQYPVLEEDDILAVEARRRRAVGLQTVRTALQVVSTAVSLVLIYDRF